MRRPVLAPAAVPLAALLAAAGLVPRNAVAGDRAPAVASYRITAGWDEARKTIRGAERVLLVNRSARPLPDLVLSLPLNAWRNDASTALTEEPRPGLAQDEYGWLDVTRIALPDGTDLTRRLAFEAPDDGNAHDRTLARIPLPRAVAPGEALVFEADFEARLPRNGERTGWKDDFVFAGQWFPQLAAVGPDGWLARQFHASTEFFADFGDYDVVLTLPAALKGKVAATGVLREEAELPDGQVRVRFLAEDVHGFAWSASPRFEVHREKAVSPGLPPVEVVLFLQPDHRSLRARMLGAARDALRLYGTWFLPYPYPVLTVVDPPWGSRAAAMEYPMLVTGGASWLSPRATLEPEALLLHEVAHQWFHGVLASNEVDEAHLDEGFATWAAARAQRELYGPAAASLRPLGVPLVFPRARLDPLAGEAGRLARWLRSSGSDPTTRPTFRDLDADAVEVNAYARTALLLASAERTFGEEAFARAMRSYARRFSFRHPTSRDFLDVVGAEAGEEARAAIAGVWAAAGGVDFAVTQARTEPDVPPAGLFGEGAERRFRPRVETAGGRGWRSTVVVQRRGEAAWPVEVELTFEGGARLVRRWDGRGRWVRYRATGPRLVWARVDPGGKCLLDVNRLDQGLRVDPAPAAASRWGHRIRFFAQNLLELVSLLATAVAPGGSP